MGLDKITKLVNGYNRVLHKNGELGDFIAFSPFTGEELPGGFWWAMQDKIFDRFFKNPNENELKHMVEDKGLCGDAFDFKDTPQDMMRLITDKQWYKKHIERQRRQHRGGELCGQLIGLISCNYSALQGRKMYICDVPIQYCPFCGVKLPLEFDQENWWEKEFKTFKWDKDHKLGEWADDYVDDHDWTAEDYQRAYERIDAEREKCRN